MVTPEISSTPVDLDRPLLVFKVGVLGCAPLDMPERLAGTYGMRFLSSELVRKEVMEAGDAAGLEPGLAQRKAGRQLRRVLSERTIPLLEDGKDVVLDAFFNTARSRQLPVKLAHATGALTVALWINTPYDIVLQRVKQWEQEGSFAIPASRWETPAVQAAKRMMGHVERPLSEGLDYVFNVKGDRGTDAIIDQFEDHLDRYGLLASDTSV